MVVQKQQHSSETLVTSDEFFTAVGIAAINARVTRRWRAMSRQPEARIKEQDIVSLMIT